MIIIFKEDLMQTKMFMLFFLLSSALTAMESTTFNLPTNPDAPSRTLNYSWLQGATKISQTKTDRETSYTWTIRRELFQNRSVLVKGVIEKKADGAFSLQTVTYPVDNPDTPVLSSRLYSPDLHKLFSLIESRYNKQ